MKSRLTIIILIAASVVVLAYIFGSFSMEDISYSARSWLNTKSDYGHIAFSSVTNKDLWFNGFFGIFFGFNMFGWLNWLAIPLFIYFLVTIKKRERWEIALCLALFTFCIFISLKGYWLDRYQLTIFPILITIIFLFGSQILREMNSVVVVGVFLICTGLLLGSCYSLRDTYAYYWDRSIGSGVPGERFPYKIIEYINNKVDDNAEIIGCYQPILYYYAGEKKKLRGAGKDKYLFIRPGSGADERLAAALQLIKGDGVTGYELVYEDQGYQLYRKADRKDLDRRIDNIYQLYDNLYEPVLAQRSLVKNGSFENWQTNQKRLPDFWHINEKCSIQKDNSDKKIGKHVIKITGDNFNLYQKVYLSESTTEKEISCFAWMKTTVPDKYRIQIYDGISSSFSERHAGDGKWQMLRAIHTINPKATSLEIRVIQAEETGGLNDVVYVDGVLLFPGEHHLNSIALLKAQDNLTHSVIKKTFH